MIFFLSKSFGSNVIVFVSSIGLLNETEFQASELSKVLFIDTNRPVFGAIIGEIGFGD